MRAGDRSVLCVCTPGSVLHLESGFSSRSALAQLFYRVFMRAHCLQRVPQLAIRDVQSLEMGKVA